MQPDAMMLLTTAPVRHGHHHSGGGREAGLGGGGRGGSTDLHVVVMGTEFAVILNPNNLGERTVKMTRSSTTT